MPDVLGAGVPRVVRETHDMRVAHVGQEPVVAFRCAEDGGEHTLLAGRQLQSAEEQHVPFQQHLPQFGACHGVQMCGRIESIHLSADHPGLRSETDVSVRVRGAAGSTRAELP